MITINSLEFNVDEQILEKINQFSRVDLTAEQVYCFPVILCDNEVDRDYERFSINALEKLAELFVGKTGIFDHNPTGENQTARIFETYTVADNNRPTLAGEEYTALVGRAYMVRTSSNGDLIAEIDGGIKKEVSVSCQISSKTCSVCGADKRNNICSHFDGREYDSKICHTLLENPTDAYEWSFVAVPAQKNAGVTKHCNQNSEDKSTSDKENRHNDEYYFMRKALEAEVLGLCSIADNDNFQAFKSAVEFVETSKLLEIKANLKNRLTGKCSSQLVQSQTTNNHNFKLN